VATDEMTTTMDFPRVSVPVRVRVRDGFLHLPNWLQFGRFAIVGATGYAVNLAVFALCVHLLGIDYRVSSVLAYVVSVLNNFWLNRHWTFDAREAHPAGQGIRFFLVSLVAFGISEGVLIGLVEGAGAPKVLAQAVAIVAAMPINFIGQKLWSFRS
jgi:putative flippase GtrA